jgi:hypothetical protein
MLQPTTCSATSGVTIFVVDVHTQAIKDNASGVGRQASRIAVGGVGSAVTLLTYIWEVLGSKVLSSSPAIPSHSLVSMICSIFNFNLLNTKRRLFI